MTKWSMCSIMYSSSYVRIKTTQELNLAWLEKEHSERIFDSHEEKDGFLKTKTIYDKGEKVGTQYPFWDYSLRAGYRISWQLIQYLLADGWEPYSGFYDVAGSLSAGSGSIAGTPELLFRKASNP